MKPIEDFPDRCVLVPALKDGSSYRSALTQRSLNLKTIELDEVRRVVHESHACEAALVLWEGVCRCAYVLRHRAGGDGDYIVIDEDGEPVVAEELPVVPGVQVSIVAEEDVDTTEGVWPEQRIAVATDYVEPELQAITPGDMYRAPTATISDLLLQSRCVIVGAPGAGKTSLLRRIHYLMREQGQGDASRPKPLYMSLRSWTPELNIGSWLGRHVQWAGEERTNLSIVTGGGVVLLLDGLDEVTDIHRAAAQESISELAESSPVLRVFLTCREGAYNWRLFGFTHYAIRPFGWNEQATWISRRLGADPRVTEFLAALRNNEELMSLATNPLALSIVAALYSKGWCAPTNLSKVLAAVVDAVRCQWDTTRGVQRTRHALSDPDNKRALLAELAATALEGSGPTFLSSSVVLILRKLVAVFRRSETSDSESVLGMLREHTGFVGRSEPAAWSFCNTAIWHYFAATAFVESVVKGEAQIRERLAEDRWQRMWLVACGVTHDSTGLLRAMLDARGLAPSRKATLLVKALGEARMIEPDLLERCSAVVASAFEEAMQYVALDVEESAKAEDATRRVRVFRVGAGRAPTVSEGRALRAAVFYRRRNDTLQALLDRLGNSRSSAVRAYFELLADDGEYAEKLEKSSFECVVSKRLLGSDTVEVEAEAGRG